MLFKRTIELDPYNVDALIQYANSKSMFGGSSQAAEYSTLAIPLCRNIQEVCMFDSDIIYI